MGEDRMDELTGRLSEDRLQADIVAEFQIEPFALSEDVDKQAVLK